MLFADVACQILFSIESRVALSASECCALAVMGLDVAL